MNWSNVFGFSGDTWNTNCAGPVTWSDGKEKVVYLKGAR